MSDGETPATLTPETMARLRLFDAIRADAERRRASYNPSVLNSAELVLAVDRYTVEIKRIAREELVRAEQFRDQAATRAGWQRVGEWWDNHPAASTAASTPILVCRTCRSLFAEWIVRDVPLDECPICAVGHAGAATMPADLFDDIVDAAIARRERAEPQNYAR